MVSKLKNFNKLFNARHFDREIILVCVRWSVRYKLSVRDLVEMMAGLGVSLAHALKEVIVARDEPALGAVFYARICHNAGNGFVRPKRQAPGQPPKILTLGGDVASQRCVRETKEYGLLPTGTEVRF